MQVVRAGAGSAGTLIIYVARSAQVDSFLL